jgi:hypothetical protein
MSRPIVRSPLSIDERRALANGNEQGSIDFLKKRFEDVKKNDNGELLVKKDGFWHMVDGKTFSDVDAWTATKGIARAYVAGLAKMAGQDTLGNVIASGNPVSKEIISDAADITPMAQATAVGAGAAALAAPAVAAAGIGTAAGIGIAAGAQGLSALATGLGRTSMGRLEGTYQATPEEQAKDLAFETTLNMLGTAIPLSVKPTTAWMAKNMPGVYHTLKSMPGAPREILKNVWGKLAGVKPGSFDTVVEQGPNVAGRMRQLADLAGGNEEELANEIVRKEVDQVRTVADRAQGLLGEVYTGMKYKLVKAVPESFEGGASKITDQVLTSAINDDFIKVIAPGGKELTKAEAIQVIADKGGAIPQGFKLAQRSFSDMRKVFQETGRTDVKAAFDQEAHKELSKFFDQVIQLRGIKSLSGTAGAEQLLSINQILDDTTYKLSQRAQDTALTEVQRKMAGYHQNIRDSLQQSFEKAGAGEQFAELLGDGDTQKGAYALLKQEMSHVLQAREVARRTGQTDAYAKLASKIASRGGTNVGTRDSFNAVLDMATQYGSPTARRVADAQNELRVLDAVRDFNPWLRKGLMTQGTLAGGIGTLAAGNPMAAAGFATVAAASSPKVAYGATRLVTPLWQAKSFVEQQGIKGVQQLVGNPEALAAFTSAVLNTPIQGEQVKDKLLSPLRGQE